MTPLQQSYEHKAAAIIKALGKGKINGYYVKDREEAVKLAHTLIADGSVITWGGSVTLDEVGIKESLSTRDVTVIDRSTAKDGAQKMAMYRQAFSADVYLTSTNAITMDGKLVNIDGNGNRVAAMIFGPERVIVFAGMNKVVVNETEAVSRVKNIASPANTNRLALKTPCSVTGFCGDCHSADCICCHTTVTRHSRMPDRIHVILIGESLGY